MTNKTLTQSMIPSITGFGGGKFWRWSIIGLAIGFIIGLVGGTAAHHGWQEAARLTLLIIVGGLPSGAAGYIAGRIYRKSRQRKNEHNNGG